MSEKESGREKSNSSSSFVVSDQEQDLAQAALADFTKGNYNSCVSNLIKLEATWTHDSKVKHNKAVAEYYKSELKKTDVFRKNLNSLCVQQHINNEEIIGLDDAEQCAMYYNQAVILFHLKQYHLSYKIMSKIFTFIEPMEESLAHKVCLLLLELQIQMRQVYPALQNVIYIITQFASTKNIQGLDQEPADEKPIVFDAATDAFRIKLRQFELRCYLMLDMIKDSKKILKMLHSPGVFSLTSTFFKSNLEYLKRNYLKSMKVLNSIQGNKFPSFRESGESVKLLYLNNMGCIHLQLHKPHMACYYFQQALIENEECIKSLPKPEPGEPLSNRPLYTLSSNKKSELMYNLGIALLYAGKPLQAFDSLTEAVQVFHMNPRLWLRLSECCIMTHKKGNDIDFNIRLRKNDLVQRVIGKGMNRKMLLASKLSNKYEQLETQSYAIPSSSLEFASLCLKNCLYLLPACQEPEKKPDWKPQTENFNSSKPDDKKTSNLASEKDRCGLYAAPSVPIDEADVNNLRCSALVASAYVNLSLGDYVTAMEHSRLLLAQQTLSGVHKMLGHLYLADALVSTNKISEAIEHLNPELVVDLTINMPVPPPEANLDDPPPIPLRDWYPNNLLAAKALMQFHLAVALAIRGEYEKSSEVLKHVWVLKGTCEFPIQVVMLAVYIELQLGHAENARTIIKQYCPHLR